MSNTFHETLAEVLSDSTLPTELEEVHLFGSARREDDPEDVDVLLVYAPGNERSAMRLIAGPVREVLEARLDRPLDLLLLSRPEMEQTQFALLEGSEVVWRRA